jgi:hypothetical protein
LTVFPSLLSVTPFDKLRAGSTGLSLGLLSPQGNAGRLKLCPDTLPKHKIYST